MPIWLQHLLVIAAVVACVIVIARQTFLTLRGRGKLGACCAKGCQTIQPESKPASRIVFLPAEMLRSSKSSAQR